MAVGKRGEGGGSQHHCMFVPRCSCLQNSPRLAYAVVEEHHRLGTQPTCCPHCLRPLPLDPSSRTIPHCPPTPAACP
jgi:hypothetical protein